MSSKIRLKVLAWHTFLMISIVLIAHNCISRAADCPNVKMVNASEWEWDLHDKSVLEQTKIGCFKKFSDAPCLKLFKKFDKQSYSVICGKPELGEIEKMYPNASKEWDIKWEKESKRK